MAPEHAGPFAEMALLLRIAGAQSGTAQVFAIAWVSLRGWRFSGLMPEAIRITVSEVAKNRP